MKRVSSIAVILYWISTACGQPTVFAAANAGSPASAERVHPTHKLPARCFAYVGDEFDTKTWKLPYLLSDGRVDLKRLPAAIQAVLTSYRGRKVSGIPDDQITDVLVKLGRAAARAGKMPFQDGTTVAVYRQLQAALEKLGLFDQVRTERPIK